MSEKKVSVIMGIYNCESTLVQAVRSIQNQTYENWELIMCDDGSTDNTYDVAIQLANSDSRLIIIRNNVNSGLNKTLNHCLKYATGYYVARMDGDDVCDSRRFELQVDFLESQDEFKICSTGMYFFDENGIWGRNYVKKVPEKEDLITGSPICHAPSMMCKACLDAVGGYTEDQRMLRVEDVNLWIKLYAAGYRCFNIQEPLYGMRNDQNALNRRKYKYRINETYTRLLGCKSLNLRYRYFIQACKPLIIGLVPARIRHRIRKYQNRKE